jgi:hypothetical protein
LEQWDQNQQQAQSIGDQVVITSTDTETEVFGRKISRHSAIGRLLLVFWRDEIFCEGLGPV